MANEQQTQSLHEILKQRDISFSYNNESYAIGNIKPSPCGTACPAGVNVKAYVSLIASGRFKEALDVIRQRNPFPGICGRVCTHPCEVYCTRANVDAPVAIRALKRFIADYELQHQPPVVEIKTEQKKEKVAIIGSGPAGLTAALDLARKGYRPTVFEALEQPGGMMVVGIPSFRLPREVIRYEIDLIKKAGVEIKTGHKISGKDCINKLLKNGYKAVFLAVGAHKGKALGIPGEEKYEGIIDSISFLRSVSFGQPMEIGQTVAVIGGGNSAIDAARSSLRLGARDVTIVYRRSREEMPASDEEIEEAEFEGVQIHFLAAPVQVLGEDGKVTAITCQKMKLGKPDASGRRRPVPIKGSEFNLEVDTIITAVSQEPDLSFLPENHELQTSGWQTFDVNEDTLATNLPGVFAGGDSVTGPNTIIDAIAAGHKAALAIERYLKGEPALQKKAVSTHMEVEIRSDLKYEKKKDRNEIPVIGKRERVNSFKEVEIGFDEATAIAEALRCLRCGQCVECYMCVPECEKKVTLLTKPGYDDVMLLRWPSKFKDKAIHSNGQFLQADKSLGGELNITSLSCSVNPELCRGCGDCAKVCEYNAIVLQPLGNDQFVARIDETICKGCGACVTACSTGAVSPAYFTQTWLKEKLQEISPSKKNIVVYSCSWSDTGLVNNRQKSINIIPVQTMCTGRIEPSFILSAFEHGADGVLVVGCPKNACHYGFGNSYADTQFEKTRGLLNLLGYSPQQFQWVWLERDTKDDFTAVINSFIKSIREERVEVNA